jgi:signal transduction histidine kinase
MWRRWISTGRRVAASNRTDVVVAVGFFLGAEVELWQLPAHPPSAWLRLGAVVAGAVTTIPLAWRRRAPLLALAVLIAGDVAPSPHEYHAQGQGPLIPFLAFLLAAFSFGAYARPLRRRTTVIVVLGLAAAAVLQSLFDGFDSAFWVAGVLFSTLGWLYRQRLLRVAQLEGETEQLRQDQETATRAAIAEERARIARELHDVVAHSVSVMTVQAGAASHTLDPAETELHEALESIETAGREALVELRRLLGILRQSDEAPSLTPVPGLAQLDALVQQMRDAGLPVSLRIEGCVVPLAPGVDLAAYRIVQEALTNSLKHGGPATAEVVVTYGRHQLELEVLDDGDLGDSGDNGTGHGLVGMRERVTLYGGVLEAGPRQLGGFAVHARLPLAWSKG